MPINFTEYKAFQFLWLHCKPIPVMKTGFSLCTSPNREKPVFITGFLANVNKFFPCVGKVHRENPVLALYWPCKRLQCRMKICNLLRTRTLQTFRVMIS